MTVSTEPRGGLEYGWDPGEDGWGPAMNANLLRLSRVGFHPSVVSKSTTAPPGSPVSGEGYVVPSGATGAWSSQSGKIAVWDGSAWAYTTPRDGFLVHVADADGLALYDGGAWSTDVLRADRLAAAYNHSQSTGNPHATTPSDIGAEPYAGVPAATSFWRSTAAGVRAWVQLVAADITDLATTLAAYLTKANPDFTGALKQGGTTRITSDGGAWFASMQSANLVGAGDRPVAADLTGTLQPKTPDQFRNMIFALASSLKGAANGVAELGADVKVPVAQLPTAALLALGSDLTTAHRGDHGTTAYTHSQATGNPHGTTPDDIGAFAKVFVGGGIDFHGFATPGVYEIRGNSWANGWAGLTGTQGVALLQMHDADGLRVLVAGDTKYGGLMLKFQASEIPGDHWSPWFTVWDSGSLPASAVGKSVLAATDAAAARSAIGAAPLPSKTEVSANGNLGDISTSAVKIVAAGVTLALTGGADGQGWDIVNPIYGVDFQIPLGVTLFRDGGTALGPGAYSLGSNRAIRIVRIDASTWILPNLW